MLLVHFWDYPRPQKCFFTSAWQIHQDHVIPQPRVASGCRSAKRRVPLSGEWFLLQEVTIR